MVRRVAECVFDGDTFQGEYVLTVVGEESQISLRYKNATMSAPLGSLPEFALARTLLIQLVREDLEAAPDAKPKGGAVLSG